MAQNSDQTTEIGILTSYINTPIAVALLFGLAGAVFISIYLIRRIRGKAASEGQAPKP
jgi:hypothetical protein